MLAEDVDEMKIYINMRQLVIREIISIVFKFEDVMSLLITLSILPTIILQLKSIVAYS